MDLEATGLPIASFLPSIGAALDRDRLLVLTAEPGAGKSTLVPTYLMDRPWLGKRKIVMLEPRRVAAAAIAARIAELLGEPVGGRVGFRVRSAVRVSRSTRIEVVTEALLTRAIQADPLLDGVGLVIFDEFHERSIHADLALALALEVRRARSDLALLVMSATLDAARVAAHLGGSSAPASVLSVAGSVSPVETRYRPLPGRARWEEEFADGIAQLAVGAMEVGGRSAANGDIPSGDVLAFLPGVREIERVAARLASKATAVVPLHGSLPLERQREALRPRPEGAPRRIVLATAIAETSLTVPGVRVVADSGWARTSRLHHRTGLERLVTERVSVSSAEQRRGRAGRLGPGVCVRFWKEGEALLPSPDPEILRADLAGLVLECALWGAVGASGPVALAWLDPPPAAAWAAGRELDTLLGLLDHEGRPTPAGREAAGLGLEPRLAVLVLAGRRMGCERFAADVAALLAERDGSGLGSDPDIGARLDRLAADVGAAVRPGGGSPTARIGAETGSRAWRAAVREESRRILGRLGREPGDVDDRGLGREAALGAILARAFPDRIARREADGLYRFVTGRVARWPGATSGPAWVVAPDADPGEIRGTIRLAAPVSEEQAARALQPVTEETIEIRWEGLEPRGTLALRAGRLTLAERPLRGSPAGRAAYAAAVASAFRERLGREGIRMLPWDEASRGLLDRLRFFAAHGGPALPDLSDAGWLQPFLGLSGGPVLDAIRLRRALDSLGGGYRAELERRIPASIELPNGRRRRIDYSGAAPVVEARIQEVFGLAASPEICGVKVVFRLLSPAQRPLQVTSDLAHFWRTTYVEVRREMRGRYPKHYWPEDPREAEPITGVRPRKRD